MKDLITSVLLDANQKGKLKHTDVMLRYLRLKYKVKLTDYVLDKRIQSLALKS